MYVFSQTMVVYTNGKNWEKMLNFIKDLWMFATVYFCKDNWKLWPEIEIDAYFILNTSNCLPVTLFIYFIIVFPTGRVFWPNIGLVLVGKFPPILPAFIAFKCKIS